MKIDSTTLKPTTTTLVKGSKTTEKSQSAGSDEVQLSSLSAQIRSVDGEPSFDSAKVSEIKQAISEGRFSINAGAIADRLISSTKELLSNDSNA